MTGDDRFDVFVCHASEDKLRFVEPLLRELASRGVKVWYDRVEIKLGDNIAARINDGLARSRFGVVALSLRFWKYWTGEELGALHALEALDPEHRRIIPVCFEVDHVDIAKRAPLLLGRLGIPAGLGVEEVARRIAESVGPTAGALAPLAQGLGRARIYNLPERPRAQVFVGRDQDMATLEGLLAPGADVGVAAAVEGLFGIGKTEVALQLAHRLAMTDRFPGGIFWLDGSQADLTAQWGGRIADEKRIGQGPQTQRAQAVLGEIASNGAALVILDNVEAWSSADAPKPLPHGAHITRLVTTRARDLGGSSFKHVTLGVLSVKDSRELLLSLAGAARDGEAGLDGLLEYLDGLALAIELAGAYLRKFPPVTVVEYMAQLKAGAPVEDKVVDKVRYEATVRAAFEATHAKLTDVSRRALQVCGCFADADASIALLRECGVDLDAETALRDLHLLAGGALRWSMHRLVRSHAVPGEKANRNSQEQFVAACIAFARNMTSSWGFKAFRDERPHLERALRLAEAWSIDGSDYAEAYTLLLVRVSAGAHAQGELRYARELGARALDVDLSHLANPAPTVAIRCNNLASVLCDLGEYEASKRLYEMSMEAEGVDETTQTASSDIRRSNLAVVYRALGELDKARPLLEQALRQDLSRFGEEHPNVAIRRANLAGVLAEMGELDEAVSLLENAIESGRRHAGDESPELATRRMNLAAVKFRQGDMAEAERLLNSSIASDVRNFGKDHHVLAGSYQSLAMVYQRLGRLKESERFLRLALELLVSNENKGAQHPEVAAVRANLAAVLMLQTRDRESRREMTQAKAIVARLPPNSHCRAQVERIAHLLRVGRPSNGGAGRR